MERILYHACNAELIRGPQLNADWEYADGRELIEEFADAFGDSQHVATMPMYQASMTLQFEHARSRKKLKELMAMLKVQTSVIDTLTILIERKRRCIAATSADM
jgi:hypothetical protein